MVYLVGDRASVARHFVTVFGASVLESAFVGRRESVTRKLDLERIIAGAAEAAGTAGATGAIGLARTTQSAQ